MPARTAVVNCQHGITEFYRFPTFQHQIRAQKVGKEGITTCATCTARIAGVNCSKGADRAHGAANFEHVHNLLMGRIGGASRHDLEGADSRHEIENN